VGDIIDTRTGRVASFKTMMEDLAGVRIVYVGETHNSAEDHQVQLEILKALHSGSTGPVLAMEMFPRELQPVLDRYWQGTTTEQEFLKEVDWENTWGYPFQLYRGLFAFARENRLRIVGLNAPREVVSQVAKGGLASLSPENRKRLARDFHLDNTEHRESVKAEFDGHLREHIKDFDTFFEAQLSWEETMAETLAETVKSLPRGEQVLVIVGKGHIGNKVGVPMLTAERVKAPYRTVAPMPFDYPSGLDDPDLGDYVWVRDRSEGPHHRGRLGVMIRPADSGEGLEVLHVSPQSSAAKAGIQKGDLIRAIDAAPIKDVDDLHRAIAQKDTPIHELTVRRGGKDLKITVTIGE
ncbi:MAG: ChaN family lipoprotein, partial [Acidobacteriota bacterium]